nr:ribonuclease H-like domain-containing protein [Tanacetum cinerariifolium]
MAGEESSKPTQPPITSTEAPQMVSSVKLPILKKGEYILWTMKIEQYLVHTYYALWEVILNGNIVVQMTKDEVGNEIEVPPVTAHQILARTKERKAKSTLLMAILDEHLVRFYGIKDAKTLWAAIKTRFGGNAEPKKMQKNVLKQQFEIFSVFNSEGLDKGIPQLDKEDLEQIDQDDLEEMDLKWQWTCFPDCRSVRNSGNMSRDAGNIGYRGKDNVKEEATDFALMAFALNPSSSSSSNSEPKKDRSSAHLIEDWETNSDDDSVFTPEPIPAKIVFMKTDRMAKKFVLPTNVRKGTGHRKSRPVWNNVQRINHKNEFALIAVFTRSGRILVSAAKPKDAASTSAAKPVNTARPKQSVNSSRTKSTFHKSHSPIRRSFYNETAHSRRNSTKRVNTTGSKAVSAVKGNGVTAVKTLAGCVWRSRVNAIDQLYKDNR